MVGISSRANCDVVPPAEENTNDERNDVTLCAKHWRFLPSSSLGHRQECLCYWKATSKAPAGGQRYELQRPRERRAHACQRIVTRVRHCEGQRPGVSQGGYGCARQMNGLFGGCLGCGGRRRRKRHLDEWRWNGLESVGGGGDVVAGETDKRGGVGEGARGDGRGVEFGEAGGGGRGALPCCAVDVGLGRVDGVGPGDGGGVLCASGGGEDENCCECDCGGGGERGW